MLATAGCTNSRGILPRLGSISPALWRFSSVWAHWASRIRSGRCWLSCPGHQERNMKAYEFTCKVTPEGKLELPEALIKLLPANQMVRVIVLLNEPTESEDEEAWTRLTAEQCFASY